MIITSMIILHIIAIILVRICLNTSILYFWDEFKYLFHIGCSFIDST